MDQLLKVVVVTRGRTGSTAILEELGQSPGCRSQQEAFSQGRDVAFYELAPFEAWRSAQPTTDEAQLAEAYLDILEHGARKRGSRALFWKALSQHFDERPYLGDMLRRRGYRAIQLRRAPVRQVISGLVARQRGVYNSYEALEDNRSFNIDLNELRGLAAHEAFAVNRDEALLYKHQLKAVQARYEDYVADRAGFFARIYAGLGLPLTLPRPTRYRVMLPDLKSAIANFDDVRAVAEEFGERL